MALIVENVSMPAEEDEIALVVESDDLSAVELRDFREEGDEESANRVTQSRTEIV